MKRFVGAGRVALNGLLRPRNAVGLARLRPAASLPAFGIRYVSTTREEPVVAKPSHYMEDITHRCYGCGVPFHVETPDTPGYNPPEYKKAAPVSVRKQIDQKVEQMYKSLDADKQDYLDNHTTRGRSDLVTDTTSAEIHKDKKTEERTKLSKIYCRWCRTSLNSQQLPLQPAAKSREEILRTIPDDATILHVFDALDFPTTVDLQLAKMRRKGRILWILDRADLIVPDKERTKGRLLPYVRDEMSRLIPNINTKDVFAMSSNYDWHCADIVSELGKDNYIVGYTNVGKSTLALYLAHKFRRNGYGRKFWGMGSWTNPWITQRPTTYELAGGKFLTDTPSYPEAELGTYRVLKPAVVRSLNKGTRVFKTPGVYNAKRVVSVSNRQAISIGGVVAIQRDEPLHLIAWSIYPNCDRGTRVLNSLERVTDINQSDELVHKRWSLVKPEVAHEPLNKVMEFRFGAEGASLAIRGIGLVHLHVSGPIPPEGVNLRVYALDGVKVMRRTDVMPYIRNPSTGRGIRGSKRKES